MDCRYLENAYELFLLGAAGEPEAARIQEHLAEDCPNCVRGLREAALALFAVLQPAAPVPTTPVQRAHFLGRLRKAHV